MKAHKCHYLPFPAPFQLTAKHQRFPSRLTVMKKMSLVTKKVMLKIIRGTML